MSKFLQKENQSHLYGPQVSFIYPKKHPLQPWSTQSAVMPHGRGPIPLTLPFPDMAYNNHGIQITLKIKKLVCPTLQIYLVLWPLIAV